MKRYWHPAQIKVRKKVNSWWLWSKYEELCEVPIETKTGSNYRHQNGCWNCVHVFARHEYDDGSLFFCTLNSPKRPPCGSVAMDECALLIPLGTMEMVDQEYLRWHIWNSGREVRRYGICDGWEKK